MTSHGKFHLACHAKAQKCVQGPMLEQLQGKLGQGLRRCKMEQRIEIQQAILLGRLNCILAEERVLRLHSNSAAQNIGTTTVANQLVAPSPSRTIAAQGAMPQTHRQAGGGGHGGRKAAPPHGAHPAPAAARHHAPAAAAPQWTLPLPAVVGIPPPHVLSSGGASI